MKVLNLYACLGGNRLLWDDCEVTAVELDEHLAEMYQERFPQDKVLVEDAHEYLLNNYKNFDFIWSSPPCPTHSKVRNTQKNTASFKPVYPSMVLYEEVIFLKHHARCKYVVENVNPYYEPLIEPQRRGRHLYWANFTIPQCEGQKKAKGAMSSANEKVRRQQRETGLVKDYKTEMDMLCELHKIDRSFINKYKGKQPRLKIIRNLVDYQLGKAIFDSAFGKYIENPSQISFFEAYENFEQGGENVAKD